MQQWPSSDDSFWGNRKSIILRAIALRAFRQWRLTLKRVDFGRNGMKGAHARVFELLVGKLGQQTKNNRGFLSKPSSSKRFPCHGEKKNVGISERKKKNLFDFPFSIKARNENWWWHSSWEEENRSSLNMLKENSDGFPQVFCRTASQVSSSLHRGSFHKHALRTPFGNNILSAGYSWDTPDNRTEHFFFFWKQLPDSLWALSV